MIKMPQDDGFPGNVIIRDHRQPGGRQDDAGPSAPPAAAPPAAAPPPAEPLSPTPAAPTGPRYRRIDTSVDHDERRAFYLPRELYEYVFKNVEDATAEPTFTMHYVEFGTSGRKHRYYHYPSERGVIQYLPDSFKLARDPELKHKPTLRMRFVPGVRGLEDMRVRLEYFAVPYDEPGRLEAAREPLTKKLGASALKPGEPLMFKRMSPPAAQLKLRIGLPTSQAGTSIGMVEDAQQLELSTVIAERLTLGLDDFKDMWESLFSSISMLFQGWVEVTLSDGVEQIPFHARLDDLQGATVDQVTQLGPGGEADVTLTNTCESPVTLRGLQGFVAGPDGPVACTLTGADPAAPLRLASGAAVHLHLAPPAPVQGVTGASVRFDTPEVEPDKEAIYQAILETSAVMDPELTVKVHGGHLFDAAAADPVTAVDVEFENGVAVVHLTAAVPDGEATVQVLSVHDYLLDRISDAEVANGSYRYRTTVFRASGQVHSDWSGPETTDQLTVFIAGAPAPSSGPTT